MAHRLIVISVRRFDMLTMLFGTVYCVYSLVVGYVYGINNGL